MNQDTQQRFLAARRAVIARRFDSLNEMQQRAVLTTQGPLLLLAGAGSGKTTVLIHRIVNLMTFGQASDSEEIPEFITEADVDFLEDYLRHGGDRAQAEALCALEPAKPWTILAITFTNKAANELKDRLASVLGDGAADVWAMTFHAACCRILRREIDRLGYTSSFTIYDTADSERVMKDVIRDLNLDEKTFPPRLFLNLISRAKDRQQSPEEFSRIAAASGDYRTEKAADAYVEYQRRLREANALDFDDIILLTVELLQQYEEVRTYYQRKFRYVLIDEYQDTNHLQYLLASLLAGGYENFCVVGDDDQSIYRFRGATIENILNFEKQYPAAQVIRLEQNYRSTKAILKAANAVISHNRGRKGKTLWTENPSGSRIRIRETNSRPTRPALWLPRSSACPRAGSLKISPCCTGPTPSPMRWKPPSKETGFPTASSAVCASSTGPRSRICWPISASSTTAATICGSGGSSICRPGASAPRRWKRRPGWPMPKRSASIPWWPTPELRPPGKGRR